MLPGLTDLFHAVLAVSVLLVLGGVAVIYLGGSVVLGGVILVAGAIPLIYMAAAAVSHNAKTTGNWRRYVTYLDAIPEREPEDLRRIVPPEGSVPLGALRQPETVAVPQCPGQVFTSEDVPLTIAAASGRASVLAWMLGRPSPPFTFHGASNSSPRRPAIAAALVCGHFGELARALDGVTGRSKVIEAKGLGVFSALHYASFLGDVAAVKTLLSLGLEADATAQTFVVSPGYSLDLRSHDDGRFHTGKLKGCCQMTPLMNAAQRGSLPIVKMLHEHCVDIGRRDSGQKKALDFATAGGHGDVAAYLKAARRPRNCSGTGRSS